MLEKAPFATLISFQFTLGGEVLAESRSSAVSTGLGRTLRRDAWWMENVPVIILLGGFGVYATLRAFEGKFFWSDPYLSPFYSPLLNEIGRASCRERV